MKEEAVGIQFALDKAIVEAIQRVRFCQYCKNKFDNLKALSEHLTADCPNAPIKCRFCSKNYGRKDLTNEEVHKCQDSINQVQQQVFSVLEVPKKFIELEQTKEKLIAKQKEIDNMKEKSATLFELFETLITTNPALACCKQHPDNQMN